MSARNGHVPAYRLHKPSGQARVIINHEHIYLGKFRSAESREKYARLIAELNSGKATEVASLTVIERASTVSINELILAYWRFAQGHYVKDGKPSRAIEGIREALRPLRELYGCTVAAEFSPKKLQAVRQHMIDADLSRDVINHRIGRVKRMFRWAVAEELTPPSVYQGLHAVAGLAFGRSSAREAFLREVLFQRSSDVHRKLLRNTLCDLALRHWKAQNSHTRVAAARELVQRHAAWRLIKLWNAEHHNALPIFNFDPCNMVLPDIACRT